MTVLLTTGRDDVGAALGVAAGAEVVEELCDLPGEAAGVAADVVGAPPEAVLSPPPHALMVMAANAIVPTTADARNDMGVPLGPVWK